MRRAAATAVIVVLVLVASALAGLWGVAASGALTGPISSWLSAGLGREFQAAGGLRIHVGRVIRIEARDLRLANASWGSRPEMFRAAVAVVVIDTASLLGPAIIVREIVVEDADLLLERRADGAANWDFDLATDSSSERELRIRRLSLPHARLRFQGPPLERPLDLSFDQAEQLLAADESLRLALQGRANDTPLRLDAQFGPWAALRSGRDVSLRASGSLGAVTLRAEGHADSLAQPVDAALRLQVSGADASALAVRLGLPAVGDGPIALDATLAPAPAARGLRAAVAGRFGSFDGRLRAYLDSRASPARYGVQARIAGPDLALAGLVAGINGLPSGPFRLRLDLERRPGDWVLRDSELAAAEVRITADGAIDAAAGDSAGETARKGRLRFSADGPDAAVLARRLGLRWGPRGRFSLRGTLASGPADTLDLDATASTTLAEFTARGPLRYAAGLAGTRLRVTASGADFRATAAGLGWTPGPDVGPTGRYHAAAEVAPGPGRIGIAGGRLSVGGEELRLDGSIALARRAAGTDLRFDLKGKDASGRVPRLLVTGLPATPYRAQGRLRRSASATRLDGLRLSLADAALRVDGAVGDAPGFAGTRLDVDASGSALERFAALAPGVDLPHGAFSAAGRVEREGSHVVLHGLRLAAGGATGSLDADFTLPLADARFGFDVEARGPELAALLPQLAGMRDAGGNFEFQAQGSHAADRWVFQRLHLQSDGGLLDLSGNLAFQPHFQTTALAIQARTANLAALGRLIGRDLPAQPLELQAHFSGTGEEFDLDDLSGRFAGSDFRGRLGVRGSGEQRQVDAHIESKLLDLRPFLRPAQPPAAPAPHDPRDDGRLIPARRLGLGILDGISGRLDLQARQLLLGDESFRNLSVRGTLAQRHLQVDSLSFSSDDGNLTARLDLAEDARGVRIRASGSASNLALAPVPTGLRGPYAGRFDARFHLDGSGHDWRELAGSLDGELRLTGRGGRIANSRLMTAADDFLTRLLTALNPMTTRQPETTVVCTAYLLKARGGVVTTDPALLLRTAEMDIVSQGSVDLKSETLDFSFRTAARKGLGLGIAQLVNPYIRVTGTLRSPGLAINPRSAVVGGGAAVATGGLSILATTAWDRWVGASDPCQAVAAE
jgi:uncharacterized protein involved in outer membrane biogenesis